MKDSFNDLISFCPVQIANAQFIMQGLQYVRHFIQGTHRHIDLQCMNGVACQGQGVHQGQTFFKVALHPCFFVLQGVHNGQRRRQSLLLPHCLRRVLQAYLSVLDPCCAGLRGGFFQVPRVLLRFFDVVMVHHFFFFHDVGTTNGVQFLFPHRSTFARTVQPAMLHFAAVHRVMVCRCVGTAGAATCATFWYTANAKEKQYGAAQTRTKNSPDQRHAVIDLVVLKSKGTVLVGGHKTYPDPLPT